MGEDSTGRERRRGRGGRVGSTLAALASLAVAGAAASCASSPPAEPAAGTTSSPGPRRAPAGPLLVGRLESELSLREAQVESLAGIEADWKTVDRAPGDLWKLASAVEAVLDSGQVDALAQTVESRPARPRDGARRRQGGRQGGRRSRPGRELGALGLTDAQRAGIRAALEARRPELEALREAVRAGTLDRDSARARSEQIRKETRSAIDAVLTPEQRNRMAERRRDVERRVAGEREAMAEALQLTAEQREALAALRGTRDGGRIPDRAAGREDVAGILSTAQLRIVTVHRWLLRAPDGRRGHGRAHPGGGRGGKPNGRGPDGAFFRG